MTSLCLVVPVICVLMTALQVDLSSWGRLWSTRIPTLMINSVLLIITVSCGTFFLGTILAFLVERTNLPWRHIFKPLLVSPLIIPCYIVGICYINFFGMKGLGEKFLSQFGLDVQLPNIYGFWGAAMILIIGSYPYVYTIVRASIGRLDPTFSEAARCLGISRFRRLISITLPLLVPAFSAGLILVSLYVLSDFGVVSLLRYPTFVSTIYDQMSGRYDYSTATALSTVLIFLTLALFFIQEVLIKDKQYTSVRSKTTQTPLINLRWLKIPAFIFSALVLIAGLVLPLGILVYWTLNSFKLSNQMVVWSSSWSQVLHSGFNSLSLAAIAASVTVLLAIPLAHWTVREHRNVWGKIFSWMAQSGVALPGVLTALGLSIIFSQTAPKLNFSIFALVCAFLVHFFSQGLQMIRAGLNQVSGRLEEGARLLGLSPIKSFLKVTLPLLKPALLTAWILVFLSSMRELPASLLLRPAGFDPLTVKVWIAASEGFYEQSALPALVLVMLSLPLVVIITRVQGSYSSSD